MTDLRISYGKEGDEWCSTVDGRQLHAFLEIEQDFQEWIEMMIEQRQFTKKDYFVYLLSNPGGVDSDSGQTQRTYRLKMFAATQITFHSESTKRREALDIFVDYEDISGPLQIHETPRIIHPELFYSRPLLVMNGLMRYADGALNGVWNEDFSDEDEEEYLTIPDAGVRLGVSANYLIEWMVKETFLYWRTDDGVLVPNQVWINSGYLAQSKPAG